MYLIIISMLTGLTYSDIDVNTVLYAEAKAWDPVEWWILRSVSETDTVVIDTAGLHAYSNTLWPESTNRSIVTGSVSSDAQADGLELLGDFDSTSLFSSMQGWSSAWFRLTALYLFEVTETANFHVTVDSWGTGGRLSAYFGTTKSGGYDGIFAPVQNEVITLEAGTTYVAYVENWAVNYTTPAGGIDSATGGSAIQITQMPEASSVLLLGLLAVPWLLVRGHSRITRK